MRFGLNELWWLWNGSVNIHTAYQITSLAYSWKHHRVTAMIQQGGKSSFSAELGNQEITVLFCADVKSGMLFLSSGNCTAWVLLPSPSPGLLLNTHSIHSLPMYLVAKCYIQLQMELPDVFIVCTAFLFSTCLNHMLVQQWALESVPLGPMKSLAQGALKYIYL